MDLDLNGMYIEDMGSVFEQLDDSAAFAPSAKPSSDEMGEENVGAEDLVGEDSGVSFEDMEDYEENGEESEEEYEEGDEEDYEEEEDEEASEEEASIVDEDGEEVDFEEYEVTLPSGDVVKLNEAISGYRSSQELQEMRETLEAEREAFTEQSRDINRILELAKLEAERVIDDYQDFDWATLSREDPQAYVENREFLDRYRARHKEIIKEYERSKEEIATQEVLAIKEKVRAANEILSRDIVGWDQELYADLMRFGVNSLGMSEEFVTSSVDAGLFKALHQAKQLAEGKAVVKAKIKKMNGSPKKVVKAASKETKPIDNKKAIIRKRLQTGSFDSRDLGAAFDMLED